MILSEDCTTSGNNCRATKKNRKKRATEKLGGGQQVKARGEDRGGHKSRKWMVGEGLVISSREWRMIWKASMHDYSNSNIRT